MTGNNEKGFTLVELTIWLKYWDVGTVAYNGYLTKTKINATKTTFLK